MLKLVLLPILFLVSMATAEVVNLPGEYHHGLSFEVYNGKSVPEVKYVNLALKEADKFCDSLGGQKHHAFYYEKETKEKTTIVRLTDAFCSTEPRDNDKNTNARRLIYSSREKRGKRIDQVQKVILKRKDVSYAGYKSIDAATLPASSGAAGAVKREEAARK